VALGRALLRRSPTAGDEGRQPLDIAVLVAAALRLMLLRLVLLRVVLLRMAAAIGLLLSRGEELSIARQVGLRVTGAERHLIVWLGRPGDILVAVIAAVIAHVGSAFRTEEWRGLPELLLRSGDQAQIMLGVLVVVLRRHRIAGRLRIARKLNVFLGNMRRCAADFDVRPVRFVDPGEWIVALAVSPPHTLVLTVSHGLRVRQPLIGAVNAAVSSIRTRSIKHIRAAALAKARTSNAGLRVGAPKRIAMIFKLDPFRGTSAALPTFHHDRRDAGATAAMRSTDEASRSQVRRRQLHHAAFRHPSHRATGLTEPCSGPFLWRAIRTWVDSYLET
jgi:hypothetical protein